MKKIVIELIPNTSIAEAKWLLKHGGKCGSYEVLQELFKIRGPSPRLKRLVFTRQDGDKMKEFSAHVIFCALEHDFEVRPHK